jgi:hypothetical protein
MSPRAPAWRLEAAGFGPVYDYAAGKANWLGADLPFEGTAKLAGMFTRRGMATVGEGTPAGEALRLLEGQWFGPILVLNQAGVVMGALGETGTPLDTDAAMTAGVQLRRPDRSVRL